MNDEVKTRQFLIAELAAARQQIAGLEAARSELQTVELALRESEDRFRIALQNSNIVVYNQDQDLRYTWIYNPLLGFTPEGILGKVDADLLLPEDAAPLEKLKRRVLETGTGMRETVRTTIDGESYFYDLTVEPLCDDEGNIIGVTGASRDITERNRVEQSLQKQSHSLGERVKELNCFYGMSRLRERPGVSLAEIFQGTAELIPPAWQYPEITSARVIVDGQEFRTKNFEGESPCRQSADIVVHGQVCGTVQVCYVETPRPGDLRRTEERHESPFLKEERILLNAIAERLGRITEHMRAEQEYQAMLRTAIDGFWLCDTQGNILDVNDALCHMLGYTREELLALTIPEIEEAENPEEVARHIETIVERGQDQFESRLRGKDGRVVDIEASVSYMDAMRGRFFAFFRDITDRKWGESLLQSARDELELRVQERTAELYKGHQREKVLNSLLRLSMENISLDEQLERALAELLSIPWLPMQPQGGIFLVRGGDHTSPPVLELRAHRGLSSAAQATCRRVDFGQCLCGRAAASGDLLFAEPGDDRHEIQHEGPDPYSHYCVPILSGNRSIGTIVLYLEQGYPRDAHQEEFLRAAAHTLAGIIERKRVEESLRQSEQQLRALNEQLQGYGRRLEQDVAERTREIEQRRQVAESLRDMLAVLNSDRPLDEILSHIVLVAGRLLGSDTSAIYRLVGPDGEFEVRNVQGQFAGLVAPLQFPPGYRHALQDGQPVAVSDASLAFPDLISPDASASLLPESLASQFPSLLAVPLIVAEEVYGGLVLYYSEPRVFSGEEVDLAVAFADQAALAIENAQLHQQAEEAAVLQERSRLARDLHDSVTQSLYSITLLAEGWSRLSKAGRLDETEDPLAELGELAQQALKEMRLLVHELRPPDLEEVGLLSALHLRLGAVEKRAGVDARLVAGDVMDLPPEVEECLYRIAIESLNNSLKHADATEVTVSLQRTGEDAVLEVSDNGCGFDASRMDERRGMGLKSMRERAERMGGTLAVESTPGKGTKVRVIVGT